MNAYWVNLANALFRAEKPAHFTNPTHCEECAEHDQTLLNADIATIGLAELGNPAWDPICFTTVEGKLYYMPAFIRLSLESMRGDFYLTQFLFHLEADGDSHDLIKGCPYQQRQFIVQFLQFVIDQYATEIDLERCTDQIIRVCQRWQKSLNTNEKKS